MIDIPGTVYCYEDSRAPFFKELAKDVHDMRDGGRLSPEVLYRIRRFFRIKNIYHSNAIEGNLLDVGETRQVVELGLTITGKPLKDQAEARNLSESLDFLEELARVTDRPISESDVRQIHTLVLKGIDERPGAYREVPVEISGSNFPPPGPESIPAQMSEFSSWIRNISVPTEESFASIEGLLAAAVAHTWLVTIHPFIDGNGRVARLLMNLVLMRYGFPVAIISKEDRHRYYDALETSQGSDLTPFTVLVAECIQESLEEYEVAFNEQREQMEWAQSLARKFTQPEELRIRNEYEVWRNAMELLKSHLRHTVDSLNETANFGNIYFNDFGTLEFEKYASLRMGGSAKRTWFLRVDFVRAQRSARFLFLFGRRSYQLRGRCDVTLHVLREVPENSYSYERLDESTSSNNPDLVEIGYEIPQERFVGRRRSGRTAIGRIEEIGKRFFEDIVNRNF